MLVQQNILAVDPSNPTSLHKIEAIRRRLIDFYAIEESLDGNAFSMPAYYFEQYTRVQAGSYMLTRTRHLLCL